MLARILMSILRVPFVIDDQEQIHSPATAERGKAYFCPACHDSVIFRKGEVKTPHFAHKVTDTCNEETVTHKIAKLLVQKAVHEWKAGKCPSPTLQRACQICQSFIDTLLPDKVDKTLLEHPLADGSIVDVALMVKGVPEAAVEIRVTHAVDEVKTKRLRVPFIELDGYEVINSPTVWKPITDYFKAFTCDKCRERYPKYQAKLKHVARECKI